MSSLIAKQNTMSKRISDNVCLVLLKIYKRKGEITSQNK